MTVLAFCSLSIISGALFSLFQKPETLSKLPSFSSFKESNGPVHGRQAKESKRCGYLKPGAARLTS
jgi:hypothetical protein